MASGNIVHSPRNKGVPTRGMLTDPFLALHREMNRLFDDLFHGFSLPGSSAGFDTGFSTGWPNVDVTETDKTVRVTAELPGIAERDIELTLADNVLTLRGEKKNEMEDKDRQIGECYYGRFERRIPLFAEVERNRVEANFKNGILTVTLPKTTTAQQESKRIPIGHG
jgi:HSP20 family protein